MSRQYGIYIRTDRCIQCHACEVACKSWNGIEPGIRWRRVADEWSGKFPEVSNRTVSYSCMHCAKPACVGACPEKAISKRSEDGIVLVDVRKCKGCRTCATVCPFHIPEYGRTGTMQKCNLCHERLQQGRQPACVATCPGEALTFGFMDELAELSAAKSGEKLEAATDPSLYISGRLNGQAFLDLLNHSRQLKDASGL